MDVEYLPIRKLSIDDRPREKLVDKGRMALSNAEILGILIGSGTTEKSAVQVCREILLTVDNNLDKLAHLSVYDLMKFKGIGLAKAVTISAALELGRRRQNENYEKKPYIRSSKDAYQLVKRYFHDLDHEEFGVIILSRSNQVKTFDIISRGGFSGTVVDGKIVFKKALEQAPSAIILCHNHPSGTAAPSRSDIELTKKLKRFGLMIDLPILDHIIITADTYYSFADEGIL